MPISEKPNTEEEKGEGFHLVLFLIFLRENNGQALESSYCQGCWEPARHEHFWLVSKKMQEREKQVCAHELKLSYWKSMSGTTGSWCGSNCKMQREVKSRRRSGNGTHFCQISKLFNYSSSKQVNQWVSPVIRLLICWDSVFWFSSQVLPTELTRGRDWEILKKLYIYIYMYIKKKGIIAIKCLNFL